MQAPALSNSGREQRWYPRRVIMATLVVLLIAIGFYLLYLFSNVLFVLFVSAVLATAIRPAVLWLEHHHVSPWLGTILVYLAIGLLVIASLAALAPLLVTQITLLFNNIPDYYATFRETLANVPVTFIRNLASRLPDEVILMQQAAPTADDQVGAVTQAVGYVRWLGWTLFGAIAIALITFFWIVDHEQIVRAGLLVAPINQRDAVHETWIVLEEKVGAFVRGQALLCLSIGMLSLIAFWLIGIPNALLLAILAGVLEAVPYVGPIATTVVAVALTLASAPDKILWVIGACILIQQIENAVLVPRIMDRTVGVNAVVTLLAIAAFGTLLGIGGAIMAIPLAVMLQVLIERTLLKAPQQATEDIPGRDHVSRLRYQAQDLASDLRERIRDHESNKEDELFEEQLEAIVGEIDQLLEHIAVSDAEMPTAQGT